MPGQVPKCRRLPGHSEAEGAAEGEAVVVAVVLVPRRRGPRPVQARDRRLARVPAAPRTARDRQIPRTFSIRDDLVLALARVHGPHPELAPVPDNCRVHDQLPARALEPDNFPVLDPLPEPDRAPASDQPHVQVSVDSRTFGTVSTPSHAPKTVSTESRTAPTTTNGVISDATSFAPMLGRIFAMVSGQLMPAGRVSV